MGDYGVYVWSCVGITVGSLGAYLAFILYKMKKSEKHD